MIFYIVTIVVFVFETSLVLSSFIAALITNWKLKTSTKLPPLKAELKSSIEEQSKINPLDAFAKFARAQRKVNKLKDEITYITKERRYFQMQINYGIRIFLYAFYLICSFLMLLIYRNDECAKVPANWFYPFGRALSFPLNKPGTISVPVWIGICRIVSKTVLG